MVAFQYRMGAGFPGDVNRTHPASIEPARIDSANPPLRFGDPCVVGANNGLRQVQAGDTAITHIYGVVVRPFPTQQTAGGMTSGLGAATPPTSGVMDALRMGYIMTQLPAGQNPNKGDPVYIWCAASAGTHVQGGFENAASGGNTAALDATYSFNGPPDANGVVEIVISPA